MPEPKPTIGYLAQVACTWEVLARKAGNVCPGREFPGLSVNDFLLSAAAIGPVLDQAPRQPLGVTILRCIEATRKVVNTNTNLGIVLLLAPLASVPLDRPLRPVLADVLAHATVDDARNVYAAIRLAKPGGLGAARQQDVRNEPTLPLRDVMALAREHDMIAAQYAGDFFLVFEVLVPELARLVRAKQNVERAIVDLQLIVLAAGRDSLIRRKAGSVEAVMARRQAQAVLDAGGLDRFEGRRAYADFDAWLRADDHRRNPGTTADLIAAALFVALREKHITLVTPFVWDNHPFQSSEA